MVKREYINIKVSEIVPYGNNPRINADAVKDVKESIRQCENLDPIEVDEKNVILSGHTRLIALQELGIEDTDVVRFTGLTEKQKRKYRLLANKTGEKARWDFEKLQFELDGLDFGGFDFGFELGFDAPVEQELDPGGEIGTDEFGDKEFNCKCPKCGFLFNVEGKGNV